VIGNIERLSPEKHFVTRLFHGAGMSNQRHERISLVRKSAVMLSVLFRRLVDNTLSMYKGTDDSSKEFAAYFFIVEVTCK